MAVVLNLLFLVFGCFVLVLSGSWLVKSLSKIASFLRVSEFVTAFILMAFATSIPELFVGITAAVNKTTELALGTIVGSNIADLTLVLGVILLLKRKIKVESTAIHNDSIFMLIFMIIPIVLMFIGNSISRLDGAILILLFSVYSYRLIKKQRQFTKEAEDHVKRWDVVLNTVLFIIALVLLFLSAGFVVKYATLLSIELLLPSILIGLFLIALGTSLPELVFGASAVLKGHGEMALGDIIGSVVVNSTLILGVIALIEPITANFLLYIVSVCFMLIVALLFVTFVETTNELNWLQGFSLIILYMFFIMVEFYVKGIAG